MVFLRYLDGTDPPVSVETLAQVYADSIRKGVHSCALVSFTHVGESSMPVYQIEAEGFYPGEGRAITISGDFVIDGESSSHLFSAMGLTDDANRVDDQGRISEEILFGDISGSDIVLPSEFEVFIIGHYSGCSIEETVEMIYE